METTKFSTFAQIAIKLYTYAMSMIELTENDLKNMNPDLVIRLFLDQQKNMKELQKSVDRLTEQIMIMNQRQFGRKTEKAENLNQMQFDFGFNEAEALQESDLEEPAAEKVIVRKKKNAGAKEDALKKITNVRDENIELSEEELKAKFGENGWKRLPDQIVTKVEHHPASFELVTYHIAVYASKNNTGEVLRTPKPAEMFEKSIATPSLLASLIHGKYVNAVPLYRQEKVYQGNDVDLSRATMANWIIRAGRIYFEPYVQALKKEMMKNTLLHADETPVLVTKDGRKAGTNSYMWVYRTSEKKDVPQAVIYDYQLTRAAEHPAEFLKEFKGTLVSDGYGVYHTLEDSREDLIVAGCWVHLKRKFAEIVKANGKKKANTLAAEAVEKINDIFHEDHRYEESEKLVHRQSVVKRKVELFFAWAEEKAKQTDPGSATGKAFTYAMNQKKYLMRFLEDADIPMTNNAAELAIRPFTIGRKNWVMIDTINGADASAAIYSIVETGKANNLNLYEYLKYLLEELPRCITEFRTEIPERLMPWSEDLPPYLRKGYGDRHEKNKSAAI